MSLGPVDLGIVGPAFLAGLLVLSTHVPLGREVLKRGIIFIDLAVAQIAGLGVIAAAAFGAGTHGAALQLAAGGSALAGALLLHATERRWPDVQEAIIGTVFVLAATGALILLANHPHGGEQLQELLSGQVLWVTPAQLVPVGVIYAGVLAAWWLWPTRSRLLFYIVFAIAVTASVQLVGVYLVFASLIVPALATRMLAGRGALAWAYAAGAAGYALGLAASSVLDLPAGPVIVWSLALVAMGVWGAAGSVRRGEAGNERTED